MKGYRLELEEESYQNCWPMTLVNKAKESLISTEVENLLEKGAVTREQPLRRILLKNFPGTHEGEPVLSSDKPSVIQQVCEVLTLCCGTATGRCLAHVDLNDAYFQCQSTQTTAA